MKPVRFHPDLDAEVEEEARFYESRRAGLSDELLACLEHAMDEIQRAPSRCQLIIDQIRKRRVARFPFSLIFEDRPDEIYIIALMHDRRQPGYWKSRL